MRKVSYLLNKIFLIKILVRVDCSMARQINLKRLKNLLVFFFFIFVFLFFINHKEKGDGENLSQEYIPKNYRKTRSHIDTRVLCMILTSENALLTRGRATFETWGMDCTKTLLVCNCTNFVQMQEIIRNGSDVPKKLLKFSEVSHLEVLNLDVYESYNRMGEKIIAMYSQIYNNNDLNYDWFILADDDGYLFMDNFYKFVADKDTTQPIMYGTLLTVVVPGGYITGGPGIILTKESMLRLSKKMSAKECYADKYGDVTIGLCANKLGIGMVEVKDDKNSYVVHNLSPETMYHGPLPDFMLETTNRTGVFGKNCCSIDSIGFHYVKPHEMYKIDKEKDYLRKLLS